MRFATLVMACLSLLLLSCRKAPERKNVLFILVDDYGYNDMSFRNASFYETPNIDALAGESMVFNEGYAACQVCSPSRASILSGKFPARHGITDWIGAPAGEEWRKMNRHNQLLPADYVRSLPAEYVILPEALKEEGYKTFFAGKWHLGAKGSWPEDHGFEVNVGGWDAGSPWGGYFSPFENPKLENKEDGENLSMRLANETVEFLRKNKNEKFFAFLSFYAVHAPIETTQEKWAKYRKKAEDNGIATKAFEMGRYLPIRQTQDNPLYAGLVESMDEAVGKVLKGLKDLGLEENTIVVFTSDNGGVAAGDAFATSNLPLRAGKGYQFEGGIREPYFIKVPWMDIAGKQSDIPVSGTDFYPTILELTDTKLRPSEHEDGQSLLPVLKGKGLKNRPLIWHYPHYGNQGGEPSSIIRKGDWKFIHYYEDGRGELYNLALDVGEKQNVIEENKVLASELKDELFSFLNKVQAKFPERDAMYDPEKEALFLESVRSKRMPNLEEFRMESLSPDFDPANNWWGSSITKD